MTDPQTVNQDYDRDFSATAAFLSYLPPSPAFPSLYTTAYLDWKLRANPFGRSASHLRFVEGAAAAHCSVTAKPANEAMCGGARLAELGDTHTHPGFQKRGHFGAIGKHAIAAFSAAEARPALIYGLPNQNALPGWLRHCDCEVVEAMPIEELVLPPQTAAARRLTSLVPARGAVSIDWEASEPEIESAIDGVWAERKSSGWLVRKDRSWWGWRYRRATEQYRTGIIEAAGAARGWIVIKQMATRVPFFRRVAICDVLAFSEAEEVAAVHRAIQQASLLSPVILWATRGSALHASARDAGFQKVRAVPVIFVKNEASAALKRRGLAPKLALGDTDNV